MLIRRVLIVSGLLTAFLGWSVRGYHGDLVEATFPGANGKIAFNVPDFYVAPIHVVNPDGSGPQQLTNGADYQQAWSPDGTKLAFARQVEFSCPLTCNLEIYVMNADGSGQTPLTSHPATDSSPAWSPDGTKIAFLSNRVGLQDDIYVMNADGSSQTNLTNNSASDSGLAWSPDGSKIAFQRGVGDQGDIFVMNADDGSAQTNLTDNPARNAAPAWSPDGTTIAFSSNRDGNDEIYAMNPDGSGLVNLTNNAASDRGGVWSPGGTKIAFLSNRIGAQYDLYVMGADGSSQTNLTNSALDEYGLTWSPDGTRIAYPVLLVQGGHYSSFEIRQVNLDGTPSALLFAGAATGCCSVAWQAVAPVGGIAKVPDVARSSHDMNDPSGQGWVGLAAVGAVMVVAVVGLSAGAWHAVRRA